MNRKFKMGILITVVIFIGIAIGITTISNKKSVIIKVDGKEIAINTYTKDVQGVLHENNIELYEEDKIEPSLNEDIKDGQEIIIKRAVNIKLIASGEEKEVKSSEDKVINLLNDQGIEMDENDIVYPSKDALIAEGMEIQFIDVEIETITEKEILAYDTITEEDSNLDKGILNVKQEGVTGEKEVTYQIYYHDGKEFEKKKIAENINMNPVNKLLVKGTKEKPKELTISRGGLELPYSDSFVVKTTAYSPKKDYGVAYTASGMQAVRKVNGYSTIAVDPTVIPLGTKIYVEGYGLAIAADTGSAIKGRKIDLYFNTYSEACNWGLRSNKIYILK